MSTAIVAAEAPATVIEGPERIVRLGSGYRAAKVLFSAVELPQLKETLGDRVIVAVAAPAHAAFDAVACEKCLPVIARELAALVRMQDQPRLRPASPNGHC